MAGKTIKQREEDQMKHAEPGVFDAELLKWLEET